ncbi:DUF6515 family protein [Wenyingzhuangia sp. 2_MG-2023]|uniref:DUF6515 family protein n=1 Tax=Wenyingzhuangia sp. 2_MG-2023 TaxID=3062639 RepID=UPI0026E1293D|nr:DUF6515 family protein [Wenyingzhuangia sp. 2_MG-2023]MDO6737262.1 DUF6515 family protein [Wenyingzhuangia sp. 2_MG-2023]
MKTILRITMMVLMLIGGTSEGFSQKKTKKTVVVQNRSISRAKVVYKTPRKKVVTVRSLPKSTIAIKHNGATVHYDQNHFYRMNGGRYMPIVPSIGLHIKALPVGYRVVIFNGRRYYNSNGVFFVKMNNDYEVVNPEIGTITYELPSDAEKVLVDGQTMYEYNNVLYEKIQVDGTRAYEVIGFVEN